MNKDKEDIVVNKDKAQPQRGFKKMLIGKVISNKGHKTISVETQSSVKHPKYKKYLRKESLFIAHDEKNSAQVGDKVQIVSVRPLSKTKRWKLIRVIKSEGEKV